MDLRDTFHYWDSKPHELKPLVMNSWTRPIRSSDFLFNTSLRKLRFNPYRGNNLRILMQINKNPQIPGSPQGTRILRSLVPYTPFYHENRYMFNDPRDAQYGAEYALACLLPLLLGRKVQWQEIYYYGTLLDDEIKLFCETCCEKQPDVWWPFHLKDKEPKPVKRNSFKPGELISLILQTVREGCSSSQLVNRIHDTKPIDKDKLRNSVSTALNDLRIQGIVKRENNVWKLDEVPVKYEKYLR